jgi:hypothetical protein
MGAVRSSAKSKMTNIRLATTHWSALIAIGAVTMSTKTSIINSHRAHSELRGFQVFDASNGADALVLSVLLLQEHHIDILVTDVVMKNMDGLLWRMLWRSGTPVSWFCSFWVSRQF